MSESIRIEKAALEETPSGEIVLRGVVHPDSLRLIKADGYQREVLPVTNVTSLSRAIKVGAHVPDITLGMRGGRVAGKDGNFQLMDPVYVIDGLQRQSTALWLMANDQAVRPWLGATIYFNTTKESEQELFTILNTSRTRLSPNILLRNAAEDSRCLGLLRDLCDEASFPLYDRVSWQQAMRRNDLITASALLNVSSCLHSSFATAAVSYKWQLVAEGMDELLKHKVQRKVFLANMRTYFDTLERAFGIRSVTYKIGAPHLKGGFMCSLAKVIAGNQNFWDQNCRLSIGADTARKIASFPMDDALVRACCAGGRSQPGLCQMLTEHINKSRRKNRLVPFKAEKAS